MLAKLLRLIVFVLLVFSPFTQSLVVYAQSLPKIEQEVTEAIEESTPRKAVSRLIAALASDSNDRLSESFDLSRTRGISSAQTKRVISHFPNLLNSSGTIYPIGLVSDSPTGSDEVGLSPNFEKIGVIQIGSNEVPIHLERVLISPDTYDWLISKQTILELVSVVDLSKQSLIDKYSLQILKDKVWRGAPVAHWISIPILMISSTIIAWILYLLMRRSIAIAALKSKNQRIEVLYALIFPFCLVIGVLLFWWAERLLGISIVIRQEVGSITVSFLWIALFITFWSLMNSISAQGEKILREKKRLGGVSLVIFFRAIAKVTLIIVTAILVLNSYGIDVTTGLAALGIGGIAIALGAQKAIENIVGSIIIVIDQPFRVGDFCQIGDLLGTVEHIGLRSTRIRTRTDTVVTFPNGELSSERIENFTLRRRFLLKTILNLRYETRTDNLEQILDSLRLNLIENPVVAKDSLRVRFIGFGASSKDVEIFAYISAKDYDQFLERQESILLSFDEIVEKGGSGFAFPSQTVYLSRDTEPEPC